MTLPKIKHVRAWFIGGATAEKGAGGGDYHDQGANHWIDDHIAAAGALLCCGAADEPGADVFNFR